MDVYVFGAGASAAEGAPATGDLFPRAWALLGPKGDRRVAAVWLFLQTTFGVAIRSIDSFRYLPAVDEVISLVDWSLQTNQGLGHHYDPPRLHQVRRDLEHLVQATVRAAIQPAANRRTGPHVRFVRRLVSSGMAERTALISLNYDTLLDSALVRFGLIPDYALPAGGPGSGGPLLAKLHGSLNWSFCPACGRIAAPTGPLAPGGTEEGPLRCSRCGNSRLRGLIISPTLQKSYSTPGLQQVWDRALEAIQQAERITFVGYSLPPADMPVYHLICRGTLTRSAAGPAIRVVNHQPADLSPVQRRWHQRTVMERFHRLFGPEVSFDFTGFHGQT